METITRNEELIKNLFEILENHRGLFKQDRVYKKVVALLLAELFAFGSHVVTQLLMILGITGKGWKKWYNLFVEGQFSAEAAQEQLFKETLAHVGAEEVYVVGGDGTQTWRTGKKIEGVGWLRNPRTPIFKIGIHLAQRWFNGSWLMPAENGYSRAMPLQWIPAFTEKAKRQITAARKEWECMVIFGRWLRAHLDEAGREEQPILMLGDGSYDTVPLWLELPKRVILLVRTAKNRVLHHLMTEAEAQDKRRKYGSKAPKPQEHWQKRSGWQKTSMLIRGKLRSLSYRIEGPYVRKGAPDRPLFLLIIRGTSYTKRGRKRTVDPVAYLVNAALDADGQLVLPLPAETLIFWAWQRWELEVCHRELKSNFGLGHKQCWHPLAAVLSVQWSAWAYSIFLLAAYRTWGLCGAPDVPTPWWRGSGRWSFNTMWRSYRAAFWGSHYFKPLWPRFGDNLPLNSHFDDFLANSAYASSLC